jgi:hypothetical protein
VSTGCRSECVSTAFLWQGNQKPFGKILVKKALYNQPAFVDRRKKIFEMSAPAEENETQSAQRNSARLASWC